MHDAFLLPLQATDVLKVRKFQKDRQTYVVQAVLRCNAMVPYAVITYHI